MGRLAIALSNPLLLGESNVVTESLAPVTD
jgi:hypothetical protein